ncbi:MAG: DUF4956 domain-containing protein, partial [Planctomycetaceae bacterium]
MRRFALSRGNWKNGPAACHQGGWRGPGPRDESPILQPRPVGAMASGMPDWLSALPTDPEQVALPLLLSRLGAAVLLGLGVAGFYKGSHGRDRGATAGLATTLVLMSVQIALVSIVIGSSVARAFSLVGALSIVRFRTVVDDTRDTAFVIFAVVEGMAAGAGLFVVGALGLPMVGLLALGMDRILDRRGTLVAGPGPGRLLVRMQTADVTLPRLEPELTRWFSEAEVRESSSFKQGTGLEV